MPTTVTTAATATSAAPIRADGPSVDSAGWRAFQVNQQDHRLAAIHSATSGDIHRITYSKNGPKIRMVEISPSTVAADSTPNNDSSTRSRRFHAHHAVTPTSRT